MAARERTTPSLFARETSADKFSFRHPNHNPSARGREISVAIVSNRHRARILDPGPNLPFENLDQLSLIPLIFIGNVQIDDGPVMWSLLERLSDPFALARFHDKDHVRPLDQLRVQRIEAAEAKSRRSRFNAGMVREKRNVPVSSDINVMDD